MPSYSPFYCANAESPRVVPTMLFEIQLNIEFRKILKDEQQPNTVNTDRDSASASLPRNCRDVNWDINKRISPSMPCHIQFPAISTPGASSSSSPSSIPSKQSTNGTDIWSDASCSPKSNSSANSTSAPSRPASPGMPPIPDSYACSKCGQWFRLKGELNTHWFRKHERRFYCALQGCDKAFHLKADLKRHTKSRHSIHVGTSRIPCEYEGCLETFTRRDNMTRHTRKEHEHGGRKSAGSR